MITGGRGEGGAKTDEVIATFYIARARAIDNYARCEVVMGMIFANLLGVPLDYAGVPFFKINNAPSRIVIIERLMKKRHGNTYKTFWDSMAGKLRGLDEERNHIVHWIVLNHLLKGHVYKLTLTPPNLFDRTTEMKDTTLDDLNKFSEKCKFCTHLLHTFHTLLTQPGHLPDALHDIFQQRVVYPPPDTHPLFQK